MQQQMMQGNFRGRGMVPGRGMVAQRGAAMRGRGGAGVSQNIL